MRAHRRVDRDFLLAFTTRLKHAGRLGLRAYSERQSGGVLGAGTLGAKGRLRLRHRWPSAFSIAVRGTRDTTQIEFAQNRKVVAQSRNSVEHVLAWQDTRIRQTFEHRLVHVAVVELMFHDFARVLKRWHGCLVEVTEAIRQAQGIQPVHDLPVASVPRAIEFHRAIEVAANDPVRIVGNVRVLEQRPQDLREPQLRVVFQLDARDVRAVQELPWNMKGRCVNRDDTEPYSRVVDDFTPDDPSVPFAVYLVDPLVLGCQKRLPVHRPPSEDDRLKSGVVATEVPWKYGMGVVTIVPQYPLWNLGRFLKQHDVRILAQQGLPQFGPRNARPVDVPREDLHRLAGPPLDARGRQSGHCWSSCSAGRATDYSCSTRSECASARQRNTARAGRRIRDFGNPNSFASNRMTAWLAFPRSGEAVTLTLIWTESSEIDSS